MEIANISVGVSQRGRRRSRSSVARGLSLLLVIGTAVPGCATVCKPTPVVVAKKEERGRTELKTIRVRRTPSGGVEDVQQPVTVREYWIQATDQTWHRITEEQYEVAAPNVTIKVCP